jgi:dihydrofolate reductase
MTLALIWAQAANGVIGADGGMPWHVPEDMAHFKELTMGSTVIMGRRTWDSFPARFRPLPGRRNVVLTRDPQWSDDGAEVVHSIDEALALAPARATTWVIGGAQLFSATLPRADRLEVTEIRTSPKGDTFAPPIEAALWQLSPDTADAPCLTSRTGPDYRFRSYIRA